MNTKQKIFCGVWVFAIIASAQAATTTSGITNKASRFSDVLSDMGATTTDSSNSELAETIRRQRALLDAQADKASAGGTSNITTANACDAGLRKCMTEKCGADFTKCAKDSTTVWGNKMDACRRNTKCTGHEYTLLAPEILADRNAAIELSYYNSVVNCGNKYNNCIFGICGKTLDKCLSKSAGDSAIAKCKSIADECKEYDNGLVGRVSGVFGDLRTVAAAGAQKDEKRLYELRDLMRTQCTRFGAMFDERTLDCVYTVNFFAGEDHTLMASKKLYSGDTFQCTPDWFGVDITTYMENAQRLTRSQKGASAAAMGAGLGTAAGLISSNAIGRAIDTQNAEKQAKEACIADGGEWVSAGFNKGKTCDMTNAPQNCDKLGGKWDGTKCVKENNGTLTETSLNGGGRNPGAIEQVTLSNVCKQYTKEQCDNAKGCTYQNNQCVASKEIQKGNIICQARTKIDCEDDGKCKFSNGLCISVLDTIDIDTSQTVANIICNKKSKNDCTGNCVWDATTNNDKGKCVAKTDSSTGGGRNPANTNVDCDKACDNALQELKDGISKIKDAKLYNFTASVAFSNPQCAKDCVTKADTVCKTLVDDTQYTTSEEFKNSVDDFKYHQITQAHAERDGNYLIECKYEGKITGQVYPTDSQNTASINIKIIDKKGKPIQGAQLYYVKYEGSTLKKDSTIIATSDSNGKLNIDVQKGKKCLITKENCTSIEWRCDQPVPKNAFTMSCTGIQ